MHPIIKEGEYAVYIYFPLLIEALFFMLIERKEKGASLNGI